MKNKILVVEDDPQIRDLYKRFLGARGFEIVIAPLDSLLDVAGAFIKYHSEIVCVISDGNLGAKFDGVDVARAIRALDPQVRILAVTSEDDLAKGMLALGANQRLIKPFDFEELARAVAGS